MKRRPLLLAALALLVVGALAAWRWRAARADGSFRFETSPVTRGRVVAAGGPAAGAAHS